MRQGAKGTHWLKAERAEAAPLLARCRNSFALGMRTGEVWE